MDRPRIVLNDTEPWERTLNRMLIEANRMLSDPSTRKRKSSSLLQNRRPLASELILLGRSDSRDYALEIKGGNSCSNDTSSCSNYISRSSSPVGRRRCIYRSPPLSARSLFNNSNCTSTDESEAGDEMYQKIVLADAISSPFSRKLSSMGGSTRSCSYASTSMLFNTSEDVASASALHELEEVRGEVDSTDRGIQNDGLRSIVVDGRRSFPIRKARAVRENDDYHPTDWLFESTERDRARLLVQDLRHPLL